MSFSPIKPQAVLYSLEDLTAYFTGQAEEAAAAPRGSSFSENMLSLREQGAKTVISALQAQAALGHTTVVTARPLSDGTNLGEPDSMFFQQLRNGEIQFTKALI
jgi:hypothetical protein